MLIPATSSPWYVPSTPVPRFCTVTSTLISCAAESYARLVEARRTFTPCPPMMALLGPPAPASHPSVRARTSTRHSMASERAVPPGSGSVRTGAVTWSAHAASSRGATPIRSARNRESAAMRGLSEQGRAPRAGGPRAAMWPNKPGTARGRGPTRRRSAISVRLRVPRGPPRSGASGAHGGSRIARRSQCIQLVGAEQDGILSQDAWKDVHPVRAENPGFRMCGFRRSGSNRLRLARLDGSFRCTGPRQRPRTPHPDGWSRGLRRRNASFNLGVRSWGRERTNRRAGGQPAATATARWRRGGCLLARRAAGEGYS